MSNMFKENGFFSEAGDKVLHSFHYGLNEIMSTAEVRNMSVQELRVLQANLAKLVGDAVSSAICDRSKNEE